MSGVTIPMGIPAATLASPNIKMWLLTYISPILGYAGYVLAYAFIRARSGNLTWNNTRLGPLRFESTLRCRDLVKLYVTNALGIVVALGLLIPWAVIRTWKYRADHLRMVEIAEDTDEVLAVLAHEIGHVELRHTMRSVLQNSAISIVVATVTSDAASLSLNNSTIL